MLKFTNEIARLKELQGQMEKVADEWDSSEMTDFSTRLEDIVSDIEFTIRNEKII